MDPDEDDRLNRVVDHEVKGHFAPGAVRRGGEDLCYTLQAAKRAEIIGETTGGGAHPTRGYPVSPAVSIAIPHARSISPVTGSNWQGTGVIPDTAVAAEQARDVAVAAEQARDAAYAKALRHILALDDVPPPILDEARDALASLPSR